VSDLPAGTVTFLFTDLEGSTRATDDLALSPEILPGRPQSGSGGGPCHDPGEASGLVGLV